MNEDQLRRYQDRCLRHMVFFAYTVPLYHDTYKDAGVHPSDITGLKDLKKLPTVSKEDFKRYYPNGIISSTSKKEHLIEVSTSGTTGKSLSLFVDLYDIVMGLFGYIRAIKEYDINWRKTRMTIIGDFASHTVESGYIAKGLQPRFNQSSWFQNIQWLNTNDPPEKLIKEINAFKPEFIGGYVGMLGHLALLKEQGYGADISPKVIASTGSVIDPLLKSFIEDTFHAQVFESYGSTESGPIAFQCPNGSYHVMSDLVHLEFLKDGDEVETGKAGQLVVTKLYGRGTPIIRYDAINDIIAPKRNQCSCGMTGELIEKIYGRNDLALFLPNGRVLLPSSFSEIYSKILYGLKTTMMKETKIIQYSENEIEIQVVLDEEKQDAGPSATEVLFSLQKGFEEKVGPDVSVQVKAVPQIDKGGARIVSHVDRSTYKIREYI